MSKQITLDYFGFTGQGPTLKEAKQDAGRKIQALHNGTWHPTVFSWRGESVLVYRTINGWASTFLQHNGDPLRVSSGSTIHGNEDLKEITRSVKRHIAQVAWTFEDAIDLFPDFIDNEEDKRELIDYRKWQIAFRQFREAGNNDAEAHRLATESRYLKQGPFA